jgi:hypothetical protein
MNPSAKQQRGLTFISTIIVLGGIAFAILLVLKVVPLYLEHGKVVSALNKLKEEPDMATKTDFEVLAKITKQFDIDDVKGVTKDDISISKSGGQLTVEISYEPEVKIAGNLSIKLTFDDTVEVGKE